MKPVLFELAEARRLVKHYNFLKNHKYFVLEDKYNIDLILIAPFEPNRFDKFLDLFDTYRDNEIALNNSGVNIKEMQVILLEDNQGKHKVYAELDSYLTQANVAKVYSLDFKL